MKARTAIFLVVACSCASAQSRPVDHFADVDRLVTKALEQSKLPGAGLIVIRQDRVLHEEYFGSYDKDTIVSIASASKWLSAATIMALVDDGKLDLDKPITSYLSEWKALDGDKFDRSKITVRQLFSHTSGLPGDAASVENPLIGMRDAARRAAELPLEAEPGKRFKYGGVSMQVAAAIAEQVSDKSWRDLFTEKIGDPCEMHHTRYGRLERAPNPSVAGGVGSTLRDYANFCEMLLNQGEFHGKKVLSRDAVRELLRVQTSILPILAATERDDIPKSRYAIGNWVDESTPGDEGIVNSSPGKFGFHPWIDQRRNIACILMVEDRTPRGRGLRTELGRSRLRAAINKAVDARP